MRLHAMRRKSGANRSLLAPIAIGVVAWISFLATAGPVRKAEMKFADGDLVTGSIFGGVDRPGTGKITLEPENSAANETPDEMRVNRAGKRNRLIKVAPVAPPGIQRGFGSEAFPVAFPIGQDRQIRHGGGWR